MKIIEAMKTIKALLEKAIDLRTKIGNNCANLDCETSPYTNPASQIQEWLQSHSDTLKEIVRLRLAIQRTNLETCVTITLDGENVTKCIAEWVHRKRDLCEFDRQAWAKLTDRGLKEGQLASSVPGGEPKLFKIVRHFSAKARDGVLSMLQQEPHIIDSTLEVVNATTEVILA